MAGYIEAVVCKSISSQMTGKRRYANRSSLGIPLGVSTAKPEEHMLPACSGSKALLDPQASMSAGIMRTRNVPNSRRSDRVAVWNVLDTGTHHGTTFIL